MIVIPYKQDPHNHLPQIVTPQAASSSVAMEDYASEAYFWALLPDFCNLI
jgi:hypothetical protein